MQIDVFFRLFTTEWYILNQRPDILKITQLGRHFDIWLIISLRAGANYSAPSSPSRRFKIIYGPSKMPHKHFSWHIQIHQGQNITMFLLIVVKYFFLLQFQVDSVYFFDFVPWTIICEQTKGRFTYTIVMLWLWKKQVMVILDKCLR